jgi:hypothetical protein
MVPEGSGNTAMHEFGLLIFQLWGLPAKRYELGDVAGAWATLALLVLLVAVIFAAGFFCGRVFLSRKYKRRDELVAAERRGATAA